MHFTQKAFYFILDWFANLKAQNGRQGRYEVRTCAAVDAAAPGQDVQLVELLEQPAGRLVDGADDGAATLGQGFQQRNAGRTRVGVQATANEHTDRRQTTAFIGRRVRSD